MSGTARGTAMDTTSQARSNRKFRLRSGPAGTFIPALPPYRPPALPALPPYPPSRPIRPLGHPRPPSRLIPVILPGRDAG